jgi:hypothetical protein
MSSIQTKTLLLRHFSKNLNKRQDTIGKIDTKLTQMPRENTVLSPNKEWLKLAVKLPMTARYVSACLGMTRLTLIFIASFQTMMNLKSLNTENFRICAFI